MKELLVFVADREADADDVRRALQETSAGKATLVGPDFAVLNASAGEWEPTQPPSRLRNLPWALASFALAGVLTGAAWTGFALGVVSGALARRVRKRWNGQPASAEAAQMLHSAVFALADGDDSEDVAGRLSQFDGRILRVALPADDEQSPLYTHNFTRTRVS